jgi:hypothetical protein
MPPAAGVVGPAEVAAGSAAGVVGVPVVGSSVIGLAP